MGWGREVEVLGFWGYDTIKFMIKIVRQTISRRELEEITKEWFGDIVKGAVDTKRRVLALGGELHSDAVGVLFEDGSQTADVWGFNIYIDLPDGKNLEFNSLMNIKPSLGNRSMEIEDKQIVGEIKKIINDLIDF